MKISYLLSVLLAVLVFPATADTLYKNAKIYTVNPEQPRAEAFLERSGKVAWIGNTAELPKVSAETRVVDLGGKTVIPGLIEGHGHLTSIGFAQLNLDLMTVGSYEELVNKVAVAADKAEAGEWILGRGWHQSKWTPQPFPMVKGFQTHEALSAVSPDNPVFLVHASGHAAFANAKAMALAGIDANTSFSGDGEIIRDAKGNATGVLNELAQSLVAKHVPPPSQAQRVRALTLALEELGRRGITSFQDAGSDGDEIELFKAFLNEGKLTSRLYVMLAGRDPALLERWYKKGPEINLGDDRLTIRAIKLVADGALGSRGAWLIEPYSDRAGHTGLPTQPVKTLSDISHKAYQHGFQVGIHAIGDRANRESLDVFAALFDGQDRGVRFRVEHAQHLAAADIPRFGQLGVIASMQGIHMSSDRPWAINRLGEDRILEGAYVWRKLLDTDAVVMNGTDAPVEPANMLASFYSLVTRQTLAGEPSGGYEPDQRLSRAEALHASTLAPAYGAFEEDIKGSLKPGKWADFVVLDRDIMTVPEKDILATKVLQTVVGGETIFMQ